MDKKVRDVNMPSFVAKPEAFKNSGKLKPVREERSRSPAKNVPFKKKYEKMVVQMLNEANQLEPS